MFIEIKELLLSIFLTIILLIPPIIFQYKEGMIFLQDNDKSDINPGDKKGGVKSHFLFKFIYHYINTIACIFVAIPMFLFGYTGCYVYVDNGYFIFYILSFWCLMTQLSEMFYSYSRYQKFIPDYENIFLGEHIHFKIEGKSDVIIFYKIRIILGLIFLLIAFQ